MRNVTIGRIVNFTINVIIEGFIDKKSAECRFVWLRKNGQVIDVCTIHINYPVRFFITDRLLSENEFHDHSYTPVQMPAVHGIPQTHSA